MSIRHLIIALFACALAGNATASVTQSRVARKSKPTVDSTAIVDKYLDSLLALRARIDSTITARYGSAQMGNNPRYYKLFVQPTFYHSVAANRLALNDTDADNAAHEYANADNAARNAVDNALYNIYMRHPQLVAATETQLKKRGAVKDVVTQPVKQDLKIVDDVLPTLDEPTVEPGADMMIKKPNFWKFQGDSYLQFLQNYISGNWYKGGESSYSMVGSVTLKANYNNQKKLKFENTLELKLGFQTTRGDSVNKFKTNEDLIRYTGKLGLQASKHWYYTLQVLAYTQFYKGLKSNDVYVYSDFMSPFDLNLGLGIDYSFESKNKKVKGSVNLSPLSFNFRYVGRKDLASRYSIKGDHHTLEDFGSQLTAEMQAQLFPQVKWKTRLYGYTTYKRAEVEWENTITLSISKYISTNIFVYPRFDDSTERDNDMGYWQFKEYCSLGITYAF